MAVFILSHNLQVQNSDVPALSPVQLAEGLSQHCPSVHATEALDHGHWMVRLDSSMTPKELAEELTNGWLAMRASFGHQTNHAVMALGGRKDSEGAANSPLQKGFWGVDVVESSDPKGFKQLINWESLKNARPQDAVFECISEA